MADVVVRKVLDVTGSVGQLVLQLNGCLASNVAGGSNLASVATTAGDLRLLSAGGGGVSIQAMSGNVGIGSTAPGVALDVIGAVRMSGSLSFGGELLQNGEPYVGSQWTTVAGGVTYGSNVSIVGTLYASNLAVLGSVDTINACTTMSSNLVLANLGTGPALSVSQVEYGPLGAQPVATFTAGSNVALYVASTGVGVGGVVNPAVALDVSGAVSANPWVLLASAGMTCNAGMSAVNALPACGLAYVGAGGFAGSTGPSVNVCGNQVNLVASSTSTSNAAFNLVAGSNPVVTVSGAGFVGIGTTAPAAALHVVGTAVVTGDIAAFYSDDRLKTRLGDISGALDAVRGLSAFRYAPNDVALLAGFPSKVGLGLSAQEVGAAFPEIVTRAPFDIGPGATGSKSGKHYLTIQYERMVPVLVQAIQELSRQVEALTKLNLES